MATRRWKVMLHLGIWIYFIGSLSGCATNKTAVNLPSETPFQKNVDRNQPTSSTDTRRSENGRTFDYRLRMIDPHRGWAYGESAQNPGHFDLLTTEDGGEHWHSAMPDGEFSYDIVQDERAFVLDAQTAWLVNEKGDNKIVYSTRDGGKTWNEGRPIVAKGNVLGLVFADEREGWLIVESKRGLGYSFDDIYRTQNGGIGWEHLSGTEKDIPPDGVKTAPFFLNSFIGFIGYEEKRASAPMMIETKDGGESWYDRALPFKGNIQEKSKFMTSSPQFFNEADGIIVVFDRSGRSKGSGVYLYITRDGGVSWLSTMLEGPVYSPSYPLYDFVDLVHGWITMDRAQLYKAETGIGDWTKAADVRSISGVNDPDQKIAQLNFVNSQVGWAVIKQGKHSNLYKTEDAGGSWTALYPLID